MASTEKPVQTISSDDIQLELQSKPAFNTVPLGLDGEKGKKKKVPRRILHFSDGTLEEYSTDEEEEQPPPPEPVNPKLLKWGPWFWYYMSTAAVKSLGAADAVGEKLAWFFGITSPKYQYAIDEYEKLKAEEEEERKRLEREAEAEQKRETAEFDNLEGGLSLESVYKAPTEGDSSTPLDTLKPSGTEKQGIDNPALKY